jgi:hypothetical protein
VKQNRIKKRELVRLSFSFFLDEQKVKDYSSKPINQKAKLPMYIDATWVHREHVRPLKKNLKLIDTLMAILNILTIIVLFIEV